MGSSINEVLQAYARNPLVGFEQAMAQSNETSFENIRVHAHVAASLFGVHLKAMDLNDLFSQKLLPILQRKRFNVTRHDYASRTQTAASPLVVNKEGCDYNVLRNARGFAIRSRDPLVSEGLLRVEVEVLCLVARRQS